MKLTKLQILTTTGALLLGTTAVHAWDFAYTFQTVNDVNASQYVTGMQNIRTINDWTGSSFWGPSVNDAQATVTMEFTFAAPTTEVFLHSRLLSYNWDQGRTDTGFASLWGSTDGSSWQLLLNAPIPPAGTFSSLVYNQDVPGTLLGSTTFWVQARMQQHNAILTFADPQAAWTDAQFARYDGPGVTQPVTDNVFTLDAAVVPEPAAWQLGFAALGLAWAMRRRLSR